MVGLGLLVILSIAVVVWGIVRGNPGALGWLGGAIYTIWASGLWPRLHADADGLVVRNWLGDDRIDWRTIERIEIGRRGARHRLVVHPYAGDPVPVLVVRYRSDDEVAEIHRQLEAWSAVAPRDPAVWA